MKKIYTKPSLRAEKFAVEGIMSEVQPVANALSAVTALYLNGNEIGGAINFTESTIHTIKYSDFN